MTFDPTSLAGIAVLVSKLSLFALLVMASRRATKAVRDTEAERAARPQAVAEAPVAFKEAA
ncbi:MAG: hypothetical protein AAGI34_02905 [Pseudomonadota bacterium]